jgi:manganese efflux pump family protein
MDNWFNVLSIAVGLSMDAFAVAVAAGLTVKKITKRHVFRIGFHFGLFQFLMPVLGWAAGRQLAEYINAYDHWLAFVLLGGVGGKMIWESFHANGDAAAEKRDPTRGLMLLTLSVATSIDALAVGMSMAFLNVDVWFPSIVIGIVTATLSAAGILLGGSGRIGARGERWAEVLGGGVLILIGLRVVLGHYGILPG